MSRRLALVAAVVLTATACGSEAGEDPATTPSTPVTPSSWVSPTSSGSSRSVEPAHTTPSASPGTKVSKPRTCYVPGEWTRYACTHKEFERNKVAVKKRLPQGDKDCVNGQAPRFYCMESTGRGAPSRR